MRGRFGGRNRKVEKKRIFNSGNCLVIFVLMTGIKNPFVFADLPKFLPPWATSKIETAEKSISEEAPSKEIRDLAKSLGAETSKPKAKLSMLQWQAKQFEYSGTRLLL